MGVVFFCQSCGARFEINPRMAGKRGRCAKCGHHTTIPRLEDLSVLKAAPAPTPTLGTAEASATATTTATTTARAATRAVARGSVRGASSARPRAARSEVPSLSAWLKEGISQVGLVPLDEEKPPPVPYLPSALDDVGDDGNPYALAAPLAIKRGSSGAPNFAALRLWRREVGVLQKIFRWLNESAYFVSVPFLVLLLFGTAVKSRPMAILGATIVVLLNIGRAAAGAINLVLVPLRDGFDLSRMKKPARRFVEPILTIALVLAAFSFVPWLSGNRASQGSLRDRLRAGASELKKDIEQEVDTAVDKARGIDVEKIGERARRPINNATDAKKKHDP